MEQAELFFSWKEVSTKLINVYLVFRGVHQLPTAETRFPLKLKCSSSSMCPESKANVTSFFFSRVEKLKLKYYSCYDESEALVSLGLFPSYPQNTKNAFRFGCWNISNQ